MNEREEHQFLAAYWEVKTEEAEGFALEVAQMLRRYHLRKLGMLNETES